MKRKDEHNEHEHEQPAEDRTLNTLLFVTLGLIVIVVALSFAGAPA